MELKIGVLLPKSDMFPRLAIDFLNGFKLSLNESNSKYTPKLLIESVGNATDSSLLERVERMLLQEEADVIVCFCSYFMLDGLVAIANSYRKPIVHVTLGARVLKAKHHSSYVLHLSLNLCQTSYVSGHYAATHFGKKGALLSSFYDGGYQLTESFYQGFIDHEGEIVYNYVSPMDYKAETFDTMIEGIKANQPDVLFCIFSYKEGNKVLAKLAQTGLDTIPAVAVPLMTDETNVNDSDLPANFYTVASWAMEEEGDAMNQFKSSYVSKYDESPNIFSLLSHEVETIFLHCVQNEGQIPNQIGTYFSNKMLTSPRGELRFSKYNESIPTSFSLRKLATTKGNYQNSVIDTIDASITETIYNKMEELPYTGWKNPYICT